MEGSRSQAVVLLLKMITRKRLILHVNPKMYLVFALGLLWLLPSVALAMRNNYAGCPPAPYGNILNPPRRRSPLLINVRPTSSMCQSMQISVPHLDIRPVAASRHHIIPLRDLKRFFNEVMIRSAARPLDLQIFARGLSSIVTNGYNVYDQTRHSITPNVLQHARVIVDGMMRGEINIHTVGYSRVQERVAIPAIQRLFTWMPGNIFIGPDVGYRFEDPKDKFEWHADTIVGQRKFKILKTLYYLITAYIEEKNKLADGSLVTMARIVDVLNDVDNIVCLSTSQSWFPVISGKVSISWDEGPEEANVVEFNEPGLRRRKREKETQFVMRKLSSLPDPYCLDPLNTWNLMSRNLSITEKVFERAKYNGGFLNKDYSSWKEWYQSLSWKGSFEQGLWGIGISMAGYNMWGIKVDPYGFRFNDGSFSVGILGSDTQYGDDNWTTEAGSGSDWGSDEERPRASKYGGQEFFDKNGRPVAIVITNSGGADMGTGWSYIYRNGKWEYEPKDDWDERRFNGETESLDPNAPRFLI